MGLSNLNPAQQQALDSALFIAMNSDDLDMMKDAMASGADSNQLLFNGINQRQLTWVKAAVEAGADVNARSAGLSWGEIFKAKEEYPAMFWLTNSFDAKIGEYLMSQGAQVDALSSEGDSALMAAVRLRRNDAMKFLVEKDADPLRVCANGKIPLQFLQDDQNWNDSSLKVPYVKAMLANTRRRAEAGPSPANDSSTQATIEVSRPLELKRKPEGPGA